MLHGKVCGILCSAYDPNTQTHAHSLKPGNRKHTSDLLNFQLISLYNANKMILVDSLFEYNNIIFIWWIQFNDYGDINIEHSYQINMDENNNGNSQMKRNGAEKKKWRAHFSTLCNSVWSLSSSSFIAHCFVPVCLFPNPSFPLRHH